MLDDVKHVEAYAIIRRLSEQPDDFEGRNAAEVWLEENKPPASAYTAAMRAVATTVEAAAEGMGI